MMTYIGFLHFLRKPRRLRQIVAENVCQSQQRLNTTCAFFTVCHGALNNRQ